MATTGTGFDVPIALNLQRKQDKMEDKRRLSDEELQGKITDLVDNRKSIQAKLPTLLDEKGQPTPEYNQAIQALTSNAQALRNIYHPSNNPSAVQNWGHLLTDMLHLTSPADRQQKQAAKQAAGAAQDKRTVEGVVAGAPLSPQVVAGQQTQAEVARQNALNDATLAWLKKNNAPQDIIDQAIARVGGAPASKGTKAIGQPYEDANDHKWYQRYLNADGSDSRTEIPGYTPKASGTGPIRAWKKEPNGKITSFLIDRQTNKPIPGTENSDILPPPYLTQKISTGMYHWVDEDNQIHETPETRSSGPSLPGGSAPTGGSATPKKAPVGGGKSDSTSAASTGNKGDKILGTKGSAPLNKAKSAYSDAIKVASLADDMVKNPSSEKDALFVLNLIKSEAGRVNQQEIQQLFQAGGLSEAPERWAARVGHGELSPTLRKQLQDFTKAQVIAAKQAVDTLHSSNPADLKNKANKLQFPKAPDIGTVEDGHVYNGGDPASAQSWSKAKQ